MIEQHLSIELPAPWMTGVFEAERIGEINFLVGPNGSGKSKFAYRLFQSLGGRNGDARILGTDRLSDMAAAGSLGNYWGDHLAEGFARNHFSAFRAAGTEGSGIDTIVLLEERVDLRIQIEATLSHLFNRDIQFEWDSGNLVPKAELRGSNQPYRLDRDECHGIKELVVLLTHLYDDRNKYLIIDEPELNLHPQYQAFFMKEVRKTSGNPMTSPNKKIVFLITHSPFILDLRSEEDLKAVISFSLDYSVPKQVSNVQIVSPASFTRRLNAHHKQMFFSDNPIFVEGIHDAWLIEAMMEARGVSIPGAGSCIVDAGGSQELNHYLELCKGLGKQAHFVYDLDSLFSGKLRMRLRDEESIRGFLVNAGHGANLDRYCGQLEQTLTEIVDKILASPAPDSLEPLAEFLSELGPTRNQWAQGDLAKARTAVMTAISLYREELASVVSVADILDIEGRLNEIVTALRENNIYVLPGGTIERYLPSYNGHDYKRTEDSKQHAVNAELQVLSNQLTESELSCRYGDLYDVVRCLPSKEDVDMEPVLRRYVGRYIYDLQSAAVDNPT